MHTFVLLVCHATGFKLTSGAYSSAQNHSLEMIILSEEYAEMHEFFESFVLCITKRSPLP